MVFQIPDLTFEIYDSILDSW